MRFSDLTNVEQKLISTMQGIGFGRLENFQINQGCIVSTANSKKVATANFEHESKSHKNSRSDGNFLLTEKHISFLTMIRNIEIGSIRSIQIVAGLPVKAEIEEVFSI